MLATIIPAVVPIDRTVPLGPAPSEAPVPTPDRSFDLASGLKLVGLSYRQARLYLVLSRGPLTARQVAGIVHLHRATAYRLIVRLLERGLIVGDGGIPQKFQAAPPTLLLTRLEGFLREEADLCATLTREYARWAGMVPLHQDTRETVEPPLLLSARGGVRDPALAEIEATRQTLDLVVRPVSCTISFRTGLLRALGNLMRRGVRIRLLTDATPPDLRFVAALSREGGDPTRLHRRHVAPVGAHYYVRDGRFAVRLPALGLPGHLPGIALGERDPRRVLVQAERFESLWAQATDPFGPARSTRAYAWNQAAVKIQSRTPSTVSWAVPLASIPALDDIGL
ncbi:MAG: TrmB family transcriptional regulator [Thermoplasmata archaeon]